MKKYCCSGFTGGSPYKHHTPICWMHLCNGLGLRADLARTRTLCSTSSKVHQAKDILTSEPFLPSNIIFWHRACANNTSLRIDDFWFCRCRSSGGGDSGGGWWQSALKKLVVFRGNIRWKSQLASCYFGLTMRRKTFLSPDTIPKEWHALCPSCHMLHTGLSVRVSHTSALQGFLPNWWAASTKSLP